MLRANIGGVVCNHPELKVVVGYFVPVDGAGAITCVTAGRGEATAARTGEGTWDVTVQDKVFRILNADFTVVENDTLLHQVQPTAISGAVVSIRQREAADLAGTLAADDTVDRIQFVIWYVKEPNPLDGI